MPKLKFTKQELRFQQNRLQQLERYLPTLQLRKALLQAEVLNTQTQHAKESSECKDAWNALITSSPLLQSSLHLEKACDVANIETTMENVAGCELPFFDSISFVPLEYDFYDTPVWLDTFVAELQTFISLQAKATITEKRITMLQDELKQVFIRVNLFEKILIPQCNNNIRSIKIFLGDLDLSAVSQAKMAKGKIIKRKELQEVAS